MEWILLGLLFCILILQIVLLWRRRTGDTQELRLALAKDASEQQLRMAQQVDQSIQNLRVENEKRMDDLQTRLEKAVAAGAGEQSRMLQEMEKAILKQNHEAQEKIMERLVASVETMNRVNGEKLSEIHRNINERLDKSLNEAGFQFREDWTAAGQPVQGCGGAAEPDQRRGESEPDPVEC